MGELRTANIDQHLRPLDHLNNDRSGGMISVERAVLSAQLTRIGHPVSALGTNAALVSKGLKRVPDFLNLRGHAVQYTGGV